MIKATGYIMRRNMDNKVNRRAGYVLNAQPLQDLILQASQTVLQDDTGVRMACLSSFDRRVFGTYIGPAFLLNMTVDHAFDYDDGLRALFCNGTVKGEPLQGRFGYPTFFHVKTCPSVVTNCKGASQDPGQFDDIKKANGIAILATRAYS